MPSNHQTEKNTEPKQKAVKPKKKPKKDADLSPKSNFFQRLNSRQLDSFSFGGLKEKSHEFNQKDVIKPETTDKVKYLELRKSKTLEQVESPDLNKSKTVDKVNSPQEPIKSDSKTRKRGHRMVAPDGTILYKMTPTNQLIQSIQLGIASLIGRVDMTEEHDLLMKDFTVVKTIMFPKVGSSITPPHSFADFRFRAYAPIAFRFFRIVFYISTDSFLSSICGESLKELSNPGASGSVFYRTPDDNFIIKTVQHREADFLRSLLPGYYMNMSQNNNTMLPKFYGLYSYENLGRSIRLVVMNNALPSNVPIQEKYDLKGSTYKRMASKKERRKESPTLKDLDFISVHKKGFYMTPQHYENFFNTLKRDSKVLESFKIMDYSLLLGVHFRGTTFDGVDSCEPVIASEHPIAKSGFELARSGVSSLNFSHNVLSGRILQGVPAKMADGQDVVLYMAIIDILQRYRIAKKMEHVFKSLVTDGDMVSVHTPKFYRKRFLNFIGKYFHSLDGNGIPSEVKPSSATSDFTSPSYSSGRVTTLDKKFFLKPYSDYQISNIDTFYTTETRPTKDKFVSGDIDTCTTETRPTKDKFVSGDSFGYRSTDF